MTVKSPTSHAKWVNPDDAPELSAQWFEQATPMIGDRVASREEFNATVRTQLRGRPPAAVPRPMISMRVDADIATALRASGKGWQTRVNALLRQAVEKGQLRG